jgi:hypothetical protein
VVVFVPLVWHLQTNWLDSARTIEKSSAAFLLDSQLYPVLRISLGPERMTLQTYMKSQDCTALSIIFPVFGGPEWNSSSSRS